MAPKGELIKKRKNAISGILKIDTSLMDQGVSLSFDNLKNRLEVVEKLFQQGFDAQAQFEFDDNDVIDDQPDLYDLYFKVKDHITTLMKTKSDSIQINHRVEVVVDKKEKVSGELSEISDSEDEILYEVEKEEDTTTKEVDDEEVVDIVNNENSELHEQWQGSDYVIEQKQLRMDYELQLEQMTQAKRKTENEEDDIENDDKDEKSEKTDVVTTDKTIDTETLIESIEVKKEVNVAEEEIADLAATTLGNTDPDDNELAEVLEEFAEGAQVLDEDSLEESKMYKRFKDSSIAVSDYVELRHKFREKSNVVQQSRSHYQETLCRKEVQVKNKGHQKEPPLVQNLLKHGVSIRV